MLIFFGISRGISKSECNFNKKFLVSYLVLLVFFFFIVFCSHLNYQKDQMMKRRKSTCFYAKTDTVYDSVSPYSFEIWILYSFFLWYLVGKKRNEIIKISCWYVVLIFTCKISYDSLLIVFVWNCFESAQLIHDSRHAKSSDNWIDNNNKIKKCR